MPEQKSKKELLLAKLPTDGSSVAHAALRAELGWDLETYQQARETLIAEGSAEAWRGRGGTLRRVKSTLPPPSSSKKDPEVEQLDLERKQRNLEARLYPGFLKGLQQWASDQTWTDYMVLELANQGRRDTGGVWTRPDFVVIGYRKFAYTPGVVRDVETFEIKLANCGITAVFETASHSRAATKSFLAIQKKGDEPNSDTLARIESECYRFGLGLVLFDDPSNPTTWQFLLEPDRNEPDPESLERFIDRQLERPEQERLRGWVR